MKKVIKVLVIVVLTVFLLAYNSGCTLFQSSFPTASEMQEIFDRDKASLLLIKDYFVNTGYEDIYIYLPDDCKTIWADFETFPVDDATVVSAFEQLKANGYTALGKSGNTIEFLNHTRFNDSGCGIAFSLDGEVINIDYMTESAPLLEDGWYYYVSDFNEWRSRQHETE